MCSCIIQLGLTKDEEIGILFESEIHLLFQAKHFWKLPTGICIWDRCVPVAIIYRLNPTKKSCLNAADFVKDVLEFAESLASNSGHLLVLGYFNRHHVQESTQNHCHILDLPRWQFDQRYVYSFHAVWMDFLINIGVSLQKQSLSAEVI